MNIENKGSENQMKKANETLAFFDRKKDKELFVQNLGWLLSQTREEVESCYYVANEEIVVVVFNSGSKLEVNVNMDSYVGIIRDIVRAL